MRYYVFLYSLTKAFCQFSEKVDTLSVATMKTDFTTMNLLPSSDFLGRRGGPEEHRRMLLSKKSYATFSKHYNVSYPSNCPSKYWKLGNSLTLLRWTNQIPALRPFTGGLG